MNFLETIFLFFAFQAFIFSILLLIKKEGDKTAKILLSTYIMLFTYNMVYNTLYWSKLLHSEQYIHLVLTNKIPWVLYGPILYLYTKRILFAHRFKNIDMFHFIPLLYVIILHFPFYFLSAQDKINILNTNTLLSYTYLYFPHFIKLIIALMLFYFGLFFFSFKKNIKSLNNLRWLQWLNFSFLGYILSFSTYFILVYFNLLTKGFDYFIGFSMVFFTVLLSYFGFLQPKVFDGLSMQKIIPFRKYRKTGLTEYQSATIKLRLIQHMEKDKPYLNHELRLDDLAQKFMLSRHHMSQIINEQFDLVFFDFINQYRVKEAKKMMIENDDLTINSILYSCGFNNRVSFYKAFKKITNITPSEYKSLSQTKRTNP